MKRKKLKLAAALFFAAACMGTSAFAEMPPIYAGVEAGYGFSSFSNEYGSVDFNGFELTPIVGTYPLGTRKFAIELNVQMAFQKNDDFSYNTITPQVVAVYNFTSIPFVQPYIGAGIGYNVNSMSCDVDTDGYDYDCDMDNAFSFVVKGGVRYNIPGTTCLVFGYGKYNVNSTKIKESWNDGYGSESGSTTVNAGTFSLGLGFGYMF